MPSFPVPKGRRSKRVVSKVRASLIISNQGQRQERIPCLILDSSKDGFRLRCSYHLRSGQLIEVTLEEDPLNSVRCTVVWIGKAGSKYQGEVGVETVQRPH